MPPPGYISINLKKELVEDIQNFIDRSDVKKFFNFTSVADYIRRANPYYRVHLEEQLKIMKKEKEEL